MKKNIRKIVLLALAVVTLAAMLTALVACNGNKDKNAVKEDIYKEFHFDEDTYFYVDFAKSTVMNEEISGYIPIIADLAIDKKQSYFVFRADGTVHGQIKTLALDTLLSAAAGMLQDFAGIDVSDGLKSYVEPMFPGFTDYLKKGDLKGALLLAKRTIGLNIEGLDYEDEGIKEILDEVAKTLTIPGDVFDKIPKDTILTLTFDGRYIKKDVVGSDGKTHTAIYIGGDDGIAERNEQTNPFTTFSMTTATDEFLELTYNELELVYEVANLHCYLSDVFLPDLRN